MKKVVCHEQRGDNRCYHLKYQNQDCSLGDENI